MLEDPVLCGIISQKNAGLTETVNMFMCVLVTDDITVDNAKLIGEVNDLIENIFLVTLDKG